MTLKASWRVRLRRARSADGFAVFVMVFAVFVDLFSYGFIIPGLPRILTHRANVPEDQVQAWTSTLLATYGFTLALSLLFVGYITDRCKSKQTPFLAGLIALAVATVLFALGTNLAVLGLARGLQGMSAAFVWVSGITYLTARLGALKSAEATGWMAVGQCMGELSGPVVGGSIYDHLGHFACFAIAAALVVVDFILRLFMLEPESAGSRADETVDEATRLIPSQVPISPQIKPTVPAGSNVDGVDLPQSVHPADDPFWTIFKDADFLVSLYQSATVALIRTGFEATLPLFVMREFGWSVTSSGFVILSLVGPSIMGPLIGKSTARHGPRWMSSIAFTSLAGVLIGLAFFQDHGMASRVVFVLILTVVGAALYIPWVAYFATCARMSEKYGRSSQVNGAKEPTSLPYTLVNLAIAGGMVAGPMLVALVENRFGWRGVCLSFASLGALSALIAAVSYRRWAI